MDREHYSCADRERHRIERLASIIGDFIVQSRIDHIAGRSNEDRVAIGRRQSRSAHTDIAAGTADVLDVELLSNLLRQLLCDDAAENIGVPAWPERNDHTHRARRIGLRPCDARQGRQRGSAGGQINKISAGKFQLQPPSHHSITSSARARSSGNTSSPSALAVCRLMTNSNLVDCTTGKSAGLAPLRTWPVYAPT